MDAIQDLGPNPTRSLLSHLEQLQCFHVRAARRLGFSPRQSATQPDQILQKLALPHPVWALKIAKANYGFIERSRNGNWACLTCHKLGCAHTRLMTRLQEQSDSIEEPLEASKDTQQWKPVSTKTRCFPLPPCSWDKAKPRYAIPNGSDEKCPCGHVWNMGSASKVQPHGKSHFINSKGLVEAAPVLFSKGTLGNCHCKLDYDGCDEGILHTRKGTFISQDLLTNYLSTFSSSGTPLVAYYR